MSKSEENISDILKKEKNSFRELGNCLVLGGTGLLGRAIVDLLQYFSINVRIMDNVNRTKNPNYIHGDIQNLSDLEKVCEGIDTIFHTAAVVWDPKIKKNNIMMLMSKERKM